MTLGIHKPELLGALEELRAQCRAAGAEALEDAVLELMDRVEGWCVPNRSLLLDDVRCPRCGARLDEKAEG